MALWPVLTLYKRPVCCVDTQLASELLSANFLFWKPGTARREERFMNEYRIYLFDRNGKRQYDHVQARNAQEAADIKNIQHCFEIVKKRAKLFAEAAENDEM